MELLARTLVLSGFGMTICGGSYPASQGEHLISHYIDMLGDPAWPPSFHGEQIAVTTLTMARLQEAMLAGEAPVLSPTPAGRGGADPPFRARARRLLLGRLRQGRRWTGPGPPRLNAKLNREWPEIRAALRQVMRSRRRWRRR